MEAKCKKVGKGRWRYAGSARYSWACLLPRIYLTRRNRTLRRSKATDERPSRGKVERGAFSCTSTVVTFRAGCFDGISSVHQDDPKMTKTVRTRRLLLFAVYLLFSMIAVAFDYHDPSQSNTCPICFMLSSLSSGVGQASFVPQIDSHPLSLILVERTEPLWSVVFTSDVPYRGPPSPEGFFLPHLSRS